MNSNNNDDTIRSVNGLNPTLLSNRTFFYDNFIDYDCLLDISMHWLIRQVLLGIASKGLPGNHHVYLSFITSDSHVLIPDKLKKRYPKQMTIVLQNRFYDLNITEEYFSVSLYFSNTLYRLKIPFNALTSFYDPSCNFVLHLHSSIDDKKTTNNQLASVFDKNQTQEKYLETSKSSVKPKDVNYHNKIEHEDTISNVMFLDHFRKK